MPRPIATHDVPTPEQLHDMLRRHEAAIRQLTTALINAQTTIEELRKELARLHKRLSAKQPTAVAE